MECVGVKEWHQRTLEDSEAEECLDMLEVLKEQ